MTIRRQIRVNGIVQGVGFRPFIFNLARAQGLTGFVSNTSEGVIIEVQGSTKAVVEFSAAIRKEAPPLALITEISATDIPTAVTTEFVIVPSDGQAKVATMISPDIAVCEDCLQDLRDPTNRRYRYPFTNCTNCGPRYTIIEELPYDRPFTSMRNFKMCPDCQAEYDEPTDRRFHAQPNACPVCGPQLALYTIDKKPVAAEDLTKETARLLKKGAVIGNNGHSIYLNSISPSCSIFSMNTFSCEAKASACFLVCSNNLLFCRLALTLASVVARASASCLIKSIW